MEAIVRFAIIGFGYIGKRHADIINGNPGCELVGICDVKKDKRDSAIPYKVPVFESVAELFKFGLEIDVVCVCTPNGLHFDHAMDGLNAGCHVVIEKPLGLTKSQCEKVLFTSLQASRQVFCVMQNRYSPTSDWLKSVVDSGVLGEICMVQVNCFWNRNDRYYSKSDWKGTRKLDGGPLFTQFSHFIDLMYWIFGDITDINANFSNFNHCHNTEFEDTGIVGFRLLSGGMGSINYTTSVWGSNYESSLTVIGENGTIKVGGQYMDKVEYCNIDGYELPEIPPANPPNDYGDYKGSAANHHYIFQNVVDTLGGKSCISTNALEGLKVVEIIERIYRDRKNKLF